MFELSEPKDGFYGEWVPYESEEEQEEALTYLALWKKFLLKKLCSLEQVGGDQIVIRLATSSQSSTLGLKFELKKRAHSDRIEEKISGADE